MRQISVRGDDGLIARFVDPREVATVASDAADDHDDHDDQADTPAPVAQEPPRPRRAIHPDNHTPMSQLLGVSPAPQAQARPALTFRTGLAVGATVLLIVLALIALSRTPTALATPAPVGNATPTGAATANAPALVAPTIGRAVVAYAAPDGAALGAISADRAITLTGTFGDGWVQLQTADSGLVWVRAGELPSALRDERAVAELPDLAPPPTATALPMPTAAPVVRPVAPVAPANAPAGPCTTDHVVAIVERGAIQVASCVSLADAQARLPDSTVTAANADAARAVYADAAAQATALAAPRP